MIDFPLKFIRELIFIRQLFECLVIFTLFDILRPYITYQRSHRVDVICQADNTENLDNNQAQSLLIGSCCNVSKSNCQHYSCSPIISPDVFLEPSRILNSFYSQPACIILLNAAHRTENDSQHMRETKIKENDLDQRPILLVIIVFYKESL